MSRKYDNQNQTEKNSLNILPIYIKFQSYLRYVALNDPIKNNTLTCMGIQLNSAYAGLPERQRLTSPPSNTTATK